MVSGDGGDEVIIVHTYVLGLRDEIRHRLLVENRGGEVYRFVRVSHRLSAGKRRIGCGGGGGCSSIPITSLLISNS